jgi:glycosyltransferase involved in cell wall biosynthesis
VTDATLALALASPWIIAPAVTIWRVRGSRDLRDIAAEPISRGPLVSIIVPARDERRNIESCVRAALSSVYPAIEVVVVDDRSSDGTGDLTRRLGASDDRVRTVDNPELPNGWFGKPWACTTGATHARGDVFCFTDADARHSPNLVARAVRAMTDEQLDMLSVAGHQELGTFWERVIQPQVFWLIAARYGGTESVNRSKRAQDKIANGQCIFVRRDAYESIGGHGAVRDQVAEDMAIAQRLFEAGKRTSLFAGRSDLTTRMYTSLREIMAGWRKNVFAGGREAMPWGALGRLLFPLLLAGAPLLTVAPPVVLAIASFAGLPLWLVLGASIAVVAQLVTWTLVYRWMDAPLRYAPLFPLGAFMFTVIALQALARGSRVEWKGRAYVTTSSGQRTYR